jgi:hypothetical protein
MEQHDSERQALNDSDWLHLSDTRLCRSEHIIPHFVEPYSSLPSSQQPATEHNPEAIQFVPQPLILRLHRQF